MVGCVVVFDFRVVGCVVVVVSCEEVVGCVVVVG